MVPVGHKYCMLTKYPVTIGHNIYDCETLDGIWEHVEGKLNNANIKLKIQYRNIILGVTKSNNK